MQLILCRFKEKTYIHEKEIEKVNGTMDKQQLNQGWGYMLFFVLSL